MTQAGSETSSRATTSGGDAPAERILVLGIGNLLMGDEGVGVHAVRRIQQGPLPSYVTAVDGGTGSFSLLSWLADRETVVMIDAAMDGQPPGTVSVLEPRFASEFPRSLTAHDIGLRDLIEAAALTQRLPRVVLVTVSVAELQPMAIGLSQPVAASLGRVERLVGELLPTLGRTSLGAVSVGHEPRT